MPPVLSLQSFGLAFETRVILRGLTFDMPAQGCTVLLGPAGTGKSTLLRTLAGLTVGHPSMLVWGQVLYRGRPWGEAGLPALVEQKPRLLMSSVWENLVFELPNRSKLTQTMQRDEVRRRLKRFGQEHLMEHLSAEVIDLPVPLQRITAILRKVIACPSLLMVDEPTANLKPEEAEPIVELLKKVALKQPLLVVSHHQGHTRELADHIVLMSDGLVRESTSKEQFFTQPQSDAAKQFLRTGSCPEGGLSQISQIVVPGAAYKIPVQPSLPEQDVRPAASPAARSPARKPSRFRGATSGPRGFVWLLDGLVAGTPMPGVVRDTGQDLRALQDVGITRLISLTEKPFDSVLAAEYGIQCTFDPIPDMRAPALSQAVRLCRAIDLFCSDGESVALHCKAGLGRTGTLLAAYWIWHKQGMVRGEDAIAHIRRLEPLMIQSSVQEEFLMLFAGELRNMPLTFNGLAEPATAA